MGVGRSALGDHSDRVVYELHLVRRGRSARHDVNEDIALAAQYRDHARELRRAAREQRAASVNQALMKAANDYNRLAQSLEQVHQ